MARVLDSLGGAFPAAARPDVIARNPASQAWLILYAGFAALPILAGLDKFAHLLVDWDRYLAPPIASVLPIAPHTFMLFVGVVEIAAGVLVALRPRIGGIVVALWLLGIVLNLILGGFFDIALRDFGLALGAFALSRLSLEYGRGPAPRG